MEELEKLIDDGEIKNTEIKNLSKSITINDIDFLKVVFQDDELENSKFEKMSFFDCSFENCNLSNNNFENVSFVRCKFKNCKFTGTEFLNSRFKDIEVLESNFAYCNFTLSVMDNFKFKNVFLKNSYFQENKTKKLEFIESDLSGSLFNRTFLKGVDLGSCTISKLTIGLDEIKGAIIDFSQCADIIGLLQVKIK